MLNKLSQQSSTRSLTTLLLAWTGLLVTAGVVISATGGSQPQLKLLYRLIEGGAFVAIAGVSIAAWRLAGQYRYLLLLGGGALTFALTQIAVDYTASFVAGAHPAHPLVAVTHLLLALFTLGMVGTLAVSAQIPAAQRARGLHHPQHRFFFNTIVLAGASLFLLMVTGAIVSDTGSGLACPDWPLCRGELFPAMVDAGVFVNLLHRFSAVAFGVLVAAIVLQTRRFYRHVAPVNRWTNAVGALLLVQVGVGGLYALIPVTPITSLLHLGLAAAVWLSLVALATAAYGSLETALPNLPRPTPGSLTLRRRATVYFKLTKPWIMLLLLLTTLTAMVIAARGLPSLWLMGLTLIGGMLSSGGASVLNSFVDSDIDGLMSRTSRRATVTGQTTPQETLIFGLTLSLLSFLLFAIFVNTLSAILSTLGILYYVFFYTLYLKRSTIHNIIIGGAAGAIPPLVGWTAVTNTLDLGALYLFVIIFFWTPPHTWALALMVKKDYAQARVPMLPVIVGDKETTYQIWLYSLLLVALTLLPVSFGMLGWGYFAVALLLGGRFLQLAWQLWRRSEKSTSRRLYKYSQRYLALLFLVMALERALF